MHCTLLTRRSALLLIKSGCVIWVAKHVKEDWLVVLRYQFWHETTVEPLLKDTPNKGHNSFDLSIKDKFCDPYRTMAIQFYL